MRAGTVAVVAALALAMGACGGDDDDDGGGSRQAETTAAEPLSKAEYVARLNEICTATRERLGELQDPPEGDLDAFADVLEQGKELSERQNAQIDALTPPSELRDLIAEARRLRDAGLEKIEQGIQAARDGDERQAAQALNSIETDRTDEIARQIGADACAD